MAFYKPEALRTYRWFCQIYHAAFQLEKRTSFITAFAAVIKLEEYESH
jgi:hypothetical protein